MSLTESEAIRILSEELGTTYRASSRGFVRRGIGDDAAVLAPPQDAQVWTIDACHEGAHFLWEWMSPEDVAHKSFHAALSDIPAMGASPVGALCQLSLSARVSRSWLRRFARAQAEVAKAAKTPLLGGNFTAGPLVQVVTSVLGRIAEGQELTRDGAKAGDELWLCGEVGLARAGLLLLQRGVRRGGTDVRACLEAFRRPQAQIAMGAVLRGCATSCLDVSDGLARDTARLAQASGVRIVICDDQLQRTISPSLIKVARRLEEEPLSLVLVGGEDYALLATGPAAARPRGARLIGRVEAGSGVFTERLGTLTRLGGGFEHRA